jgi:hypothetical protein
VRCTTNGENDAFQRASFRWARPLNPKVAGSIPARPIKEDAARKYFLNSARPGARRRSSRTGSSTSPSSGRARRCSFRRTRGGT